MTATDQYTLKRDHFLRKVLWVDTLMGGSTALIGIFFVQFLTQFLGLPPGLIRLIAIITLLYGIVAFVLSVQKEISVQLLRTLVMANWLWTLVSVILLLIYFDSTTTPGLIFLLMQIVVVGGLAYVEGRQLARKAG